MTSRFPRPPLRRRPRSGRAPLRTAAALAAAAALALTAPLPAAAAVPPGGTTGQAVAEAKRAQAPIAPGDLTFGAEPLAAAESAAADAASGAACSVSADEATALTLAPVWPEVAAGSTDAPSPMTLSRYDNQDGLYDPSGRDGLFFNPGVGLWQLDSAGMGAGNDAGQAIDAQWAAGKVAPEIVDRYCSNVNGGSAPADARADAWTPWHACDDGACEDVYNRALDGVVADDGVGRYGGAEARRCFYGGSGHDCLYVDPAAAQGTDWWTRPDAGASPVPRPFYVLTSGDSEVRAWIADDSGAGTTVTATRPLGSNARTSLSWSDTDALCDLTQSRGDC
ncbi:hypothetical protein [Nocardiopsis coralliicola]